MPVIPPRDAVAFFLMFLVAGLVAIAVWSAWKEGQARKAAITRARAALVSRPGTTFHEGANAALDGIGWRRNPYYAPGESCERGNAWHAGWCYAFLLLEQVWEAP